MKISRKLLPIFILVLLSCALCACGKQPPAPAAAQQANFWAMDTIFTTTICTDNSTLNEQAFQSVEQEILRVEQLTSRYTKDANQNVAAINAAAGIAPVAVSSELFDLIALGLEWYQKTDGDFSIVMGPLADLWKNEQQIPPSQQQVTAALALCNPQDVQLDKQKHTVYLMKAGMSLDLGGIAKGYATACAMRQLETLGIANASIDGGGSSLLTRGLNDKGKPWRIGITHPRQQGELTTAVQVQNMAVVSSGDYQRYFEYQGKRYHHIIDPHTGYPAEGSIAVTVVAADATLADVLSTAIFVGGAEKAAAYAQAYSSVLLTDENLQLTPLGNFEQQRIMDYSKDFTLKK